MTNETTGQVVTASGTLTDTSVLFGAATEPGRQVASFGSAQLVKSSIDGVRIKADDLRRAGLASPFAGYFSTQWASIIGSVVNDAPNDWGVGVEPSVHETTYESVLVLLRGDEDPRSEWLWATRVDATDAGGTYRLANSGFYSPLVLGDLVEVRRNVGDRRQVIGVRERGGRPGWLVHLEEDDTQAERLIMEWRASGTIVEERGRTVSVALDASRLADGRPTEAELLELVQNDLVRGYLRLSDGSVLTEAEADWMDFRRQRRRTPRPLAPSLVLLPAQRAG